MKLFRILTLISFLLSLQSCDWAKETSKKTVHKTGEMVAETGSEFVDGVQNGIEKSFEHTISISENLKQKGLKLGKTSISSSDTATDNIVSVYVIFEKTISENIRLKVLDDKGVEYGRTTKFITGKKDEARYEDFVFSKRTNIDKKGTLVFE
ncbi:MAG: hypothetical protein U0V72_15345 [Cytophagales bacterium]